ncbi:hypothetical protein Peur_058653 [Populus x canadensis]|jgi:hypothetical protein
MHADMFDLEDKKLKTVLGFVSSRCDEGYRMPRWNGLGFKRKRSIKENVSLLKKIKINGANSQCANKSLCLRVINGANSGIGHLINPSAVVPAF